MKKFISLLLATVMIFSLAACGAGGGAKGGDDDKIENAVGTSLKRWERLYMKTASIFYHNPNPAADLPAARSHKRP